MSIPLFSRKVSGDGLTAPEDIFIKISCFQTEGYFIRFSIFLLILIQISTLYAQIVDTTILGDGGPGPYVLGNSFLDSSSIKVKFTDSSSVPQWIYIADNNAILFSDNIDSGKTLQIHYVKKYYGLPKIYSLFPKVRLQIRDSITIEAEKSRSASILSERENLSVSGYKSISVAAGNLGQISLEQGLDVQIGGELRPGTELKAHFSDQGSTLDGATREISEFDMIYVTLSDPRFNVVAGDQFLNWPFEGILSGQKKIKGLSVSAHSKKISVGTFGALSGGKFTTETWHGRNGLQGPYNLSGKGEKGIITPIGGTVKVKLNGKKLEEGDEKDFTVDYDLGSITFLPKIPIRDDDLIIVDYEYKIFDYQRTLFGTTAGFSTSDSILSFQGVLWSEADNKKHLIDVSYDSSDLAELRKSGDSPVYGYNYRAVHENDVPEESGYEPLYQKIDSLGMIIFHYKPFDPKHPDDRGGRYLVYFSYEGKGKGSYIRDTTITVHQVYKYVGEGSGDYLPRTQLSTPKRLTTGEITGELRLEKLKVKFNGAGQDFDKNLFSSSNDDDNRGSAVRGSFLAGQKDFGIKSIWLSGNYNYSSKYFDNELLNAYDRYSQWDDSTRKDFQKENQFWEGYFGLTPVKRVTAEIGYGQKLIDKSLTTDKISYYSRIGILKKLQLEYTGTLFHHYTESKKESVNRKGVTRLLFQPDKHSFELSYKDEWLRDTSKYGSGLMGGLLYYEFFPLHLKQNFEFNQYRSGKGKLFEATDTGWAFSWEQSIDNQLFSWWKLSGTSSFFTSKTGSAKSNDRLSSTTFLIDANSVMEFAKTGLSSSQHYRLSSEKMSSIIQVPVLTVKGQGTHIYDDSLKEYVPHANGDYLLQQREIYDSTDFRVKKKLIDLSWSFSPVKKLKGIINDLDWAGTLLLEEHVDSRTKGWRAWIPGILSLKNYKSPFENKSINFADLSYRQEIEWNPEDFKNISGDLFTFLSLRKIRSYQETGIESGLNFEIRHGKLTLGNEVRYCRVFHDDSLIQDFYVRDLNTVLSQKFQFIDAFGIYLQECLGWARKDDRFSKSKQVRPDSCVYLQLNPGVQWRPLEHGFAEASYFISFAPLPGEIDYRMARGMSAGLSHVISVSTDFQIGKHFSLSGSYRGEMKKLAGKSDYEKGEHTVTMEMKAFL